MTIQDSSRATFARCRIQWGVAGDGRQNDFPVLDAADLDAALDLVACCAIAEQEVFQVDLYLDTWMVGDPDVVQLLVGDAGRSSLLAHYDGEAQVAADPALPPLAGDLAYDHLGHRSAMEPDRTRVTPAQARAALAELLATGRLPAWLDWVETPQD